jgi:hypothetical protein
MTAAQQRHEVFKILTRLDTLRLGLRDRAADGTELVEELELFACAAESLADQARTLACKLDESAEREAAEQEGMRHAAE